VFVPEKTRQLITALKCLLRLTPGSNRHRSVTLGLAVPGEDSRPAFAMLESINQSINQTISCQFLPPDGSTGPRYVLQLLFSGKIRKSLMTQQPLKLEKK
jgi:hypothetical protein